MAGNLNHYYDREMVNFFIVKYIDFLENRSTSFYLPFLISDFTEFDKWNEEELSLIFWEFKNHKLDDIKNDHIIKWIEEINNFFTDYKKPRKKGKISYLISGSLLNEDLIRTGSLSNDYIQFEEIDYTMYKYANKNASDIKTLYSFAEKHGFVFSKLSSFLEYFIYGKVINVFVRINKIKISKKYSNQNKTFKNDVVKLIEKDFREILERIPMNIKSFTKYYNSFEIKNYQIYVDKIIPRLNESDIKDVNKLGTELLSMIPIIIDSDSLYNKLKINDFKLYIKEFLKNENKVDEILKILIEEVKND